MPIVTYDCQVGSSAVGVWTNALGLNIVLLDGGFPIIGGIRIPDFGEFSDGENRFLIDQDLAWGGLSWTYGVATPGALQIRVVNAADPPLFSNTNLPEDQSYYDGGFTILTDDFPLGDLTPTLEPIFRELLQRAIKRNGWVEGNAVAFTLTPLHAAFISTFRINHWRTVVNGLDAHYLLQNEPSSIADRQHKGVRWFADPRTGVEHPISDAVRDGERRGLFVDRDSSDQAGRRKLRRPIRRERRDLLWPKI